MSAHYLGVWLAFCISAWRLRRAWGANDRSGDCHRLGCPSKWSLPPCPTTGARPGQAGRRAETRRACSACSRRVSSGSGPLLARAASTDAIPALRLTSDLPRHRDEWAGSLLRHSRFVLHQDSPVTFHLRSSPLPACSQETSASQRILASDSIAQLQAS